VQFAEAQAMSKLTLRFDPNFKSSGASSDRANLRIVSREPFSPIASFLLGMTAGLGGALGVFVLFFR
jgi:hypothetical protein